MRNPWPMFCVLALTGLVCILFPVHTVWLLVLFGVLLLVAWIVLPAKYDDWFAGKINPYVSEYQAEHDIDKLEKGLNECRSWAVTKTSRNVMEINWFCALLEQGRFEEARKVLEQIKQRAKTTVDWFNYHLLMVEYAEKIGDEQLAENERQLCDTYKARTEQKKSSLNEPATAKQSKKAFLLWLTFVLFLMLGGVICFVFIVNDTVRDLSAWAVVLSLFALPVALAWLIIWLVRRAKEK